MIHHIFDEPYYLPINATRTAFRRGLKWGGVLFILGIILGYLWAWKAMGGGI